MRVRSILLGLGLLAAVPAFAQAPSPNAGKNAMNWEALVKLYPPRALAAREEGLVGFLVKLDSKGHPTECRVTHSSGHPLLDEETCELITLHAVFKPAQGVSGTQLSTHQGVVNWKLPTSTSSTLISPKPLTAAAAPEKVVCKRVPRTGSNAGFERVCMTKNEWQRSTDESRQPWDEMQGRKGLTSGN
jgi:TonB family protein